MEDGSDFPVGCALRSLRLALLAVSLTGFLVPRAALALQEPVDLELVLAVDASSSVSAEEFDLQIKGLAEAFRSPEVLAAVQAGGDLGIAVSLMQWSDNRKQVLAVDWSAVRDETSTLALADQIEATPRYLVGGGTAIGGAIHFAVRQFDNNGFEGRRRVIDVSGDGRTNQGSQPSDERDVAVALGITINGLAILNEDPTVDNYYYRNVIGGTGAFVLTANDYESYALAILSKLIREIGSVPIAEVLPLDGPSAVEGVVPGRLLGAVPPKDAGKTPAIPRAGLESPPGNG
jgi:hypothetical protein